MKLFKPPQSDFWHIEIITEAGSKRTINTFCTTCEEAEAVVSKAKVPELETASKVLRLTSEVVTLITANRSVTVADAITEWDAWLKVTARSERTRTNNVIAVRQWSREMGLEAKTIGSITTDDIHRWVNRPNQTDKRGTRLMKLSAIRNLFRFCGLKRYVLSDPSQLVAVDFRLMNHRQKETKHKAVFSDHDIEYLLANAHGAEPPSITPGFFKAAIILGRDLGLRLGDICNLEWACFDLPAKTATIWTDKSNTRVQLPVTERVIELLGTLPRLDETYVFPNERAIVNDPVRRATLSMAFGRFFRELGFRGLSFHSLRASYATTMALQGAELSAIAERLGHKSVRTTSVYVSNERPGQAMADGVSTTGLGSPKS